jgi:hypothetical protein
MTASFRKTVSSDRFLLALSLLLQIFLATFFGHAYDMKIFMATGYLAGTGQNPYVAQNLTAIFHNNAFQGMTSVGYPPPWPLVTGLIYLVTYRIVPNLLLYNLALKIPIIAANICLAFLVVRILDRLGAGKKQARVAGLFILFNPLMLYCTAAWGQLDSIVALLSLLALVWLKDGKFTASALLLALAISFKPTALPIVPAVFIYMLGRPFRLLLRYFSVFLICAFLLFVGPFAVFRWDPSLILQHWNAQFSVGGGLSFMTFLELIQGSYQLPGLWWLVGLLWVPALGIAAVRLKPGGDGLIDLIKKSTALIMVFFLFRTWLSEPNLILVLPMILILVSLGEMDSRLLTAMWVIALVYSFFNTSTFQLLFPSLPALMDRLLQLSEVFRLPRLIIRIILVIPWLWVGDRVAILCMKADRAAIEALQA